jgi:hypothetical protein
MKNMKPRGLFVAIMILTASVFTSQQVIAQSNSLDNKKQPVQNTQKQEAVKSENRNVNSQTISSKPTLNERDQQKMSNASKQAADKNAVETREHTIIDHPGYPKYEMSGDVKADELRYQEAKTKWIRENPEAYQKLLNKDPKVKEEEVRKYRKTPDSK